MLGRLRQILLTQYIGAIMIAYLGAQIVVEIAATILNPLQWFLYRNVQQRGLFGTEPAQEWFDPRAVVLQLVTIAVHLLAVYLLLNWLYGSDLKPKEPVMEAEEQD